MKYIFLTVLLLVSLPLQAAETLDYAETLHFTWARVPLGQLQLEMHAEGDAYRMKAVGKTQGIALLFSRHYSTTLVKGVGLKPQDYRSDYVDNGEKRLIAIRYNKHGLPAEEMIIPPREEIRPLVPAEAKQGSVDILTGFFVMREKLRIALKRKTPSFSTTIYDGKRLFRVDATIEKRLMQVRFHGITRPAIKLSLQRVPLAGYKEKELKKLAIRNPAIALYVEPERLVPFGLSTPVYGAKLEAWALPPSAKKGSP